MDLRISQLFLFKMQKSNIKMEKYKSKFKNKKRETTNHTNNTNKKTASFLFQKQTFLIYLCYLCYLLLKNGVLGEKKTRIFPPSNFSLCRRVNFYIFICHFAF